MPHNIKTTSLSFPSNDFPLTHSPLLALRQPNPLPSGYAPLLEYPGTMRPSKVRENSPFEDLPLKQR